jgi:formylglycine-generating enzyme required for sulfatase activity
MAFCRWLSYQINRVYELDRIADWAVRLPTEYEWEKAARGREGFFYPYGDQFDATKSNIQEARSGGTTPVMQYTAGQSEYGVMDMSGNVWEWCLSAYQTPHLLPDKENLTKVSDRVLRGGSWANPGYDSRAVYRHASSPRLRSENYGFRVMCSF